MRHNDNHCVWSGGFGIQDLLDSAEFTSKQDQITNLANSMYFIRLLSTDFEELVVNCFYLRRKSDLKDPLLFVIRALGRIGKDLDSADLVYRMAAGEQ